MAGVEFEITADTSDLKKEVEAAGKALKKLEREAEKAGKGLSDMSKAKKRAAKASKDLAKAEKSQASQAKKTAKANDDLKASVKGVAAAVLGAGIAILAMTKEIADQRNAIVDMSARTGVATDTLLGLQLAAEGAGRQFEDMNEVINPLVARLGQVRAGSESAEDAFTSLGVSVRDSKGEVISNDEALKRVIKTIQAVEDPGKKASTAIGLIGESGGKLIQVLGDVPLEAFVDQAERFGVGVGPEAAASAATLQRSIADLSLVTQGALADFTDFFGVTALIDNFTLGFVFANETVKGVLENITAQAQVAGDLLTAVFDGDVEAMARLAQEGQDLQTQMNAMTFGQEEAAKAFFDNRNAIRAAGEAATTTSGQTNDLAQSHKDAAEAAKEQEAAEKQLLNVFALAMAAVDDLADANQTATESLVHESEQRITAIQNEVNAIQAGTNERVQAEIAAAAGIAAIREKLRQDIDDIQTAQLEDNLEFVDAGVESFIESEDKKKEKALATADEIQAANETLRGALIDSAFMVADAVVDALSQQREARLAEAEAEIDSQIAVLENKEKLSLAEQDMLGELNHKKKQIAVMEFRREKATAMAGIVLNTAKAMLVAAAAAPPPANIPLIAAAGFLGAAQLGIAAAQQGPTFHDGGLVAPDEVKATLKNEEFVVTSQASRNNREQLKELNRTGSMSSAPQITVMIGDEAIADHLVRISRGDNQFGRMMRDPSPSRRTVTR